MAGPPAHVTAEIATLIVAAIAEGRPLYRACREAAVSVLDWVEALARDPDLAEKVATAERARAYRYMDEALEIADTDADSNRARVRTHVRLKAASYFDRAKFGDAPPTVNFGISLAGALADARSRVLTASPVAELSSPIPPTAEYVRAGIVELAPDPGSGCDPDATGAAMPFADPFDNAGDLIVHTTDNVSRRLAELVTMSADGLESALR